MNRNQRVEQVLSFLRLLADTEHNPISIKWEILLPAYNIPPEHKDSFISTYLDVYTCKERNDKKYSWKKYLKYPTKEVADKLLVDLNLDNEVINFIIPPDVIPSIAKEEPKKKRLGIKHADMDQHYLDVLNKIYEMTKESYSNVATAIGSGTNIMPISEAIGSVILPTIEDLNKLAETTTKNKGKRTHNHKPVLTLFQKVIVKLFNIPNGWKS